LVRLFDSLEAQSLRDLEVILVDQNKDDRLSELLEREWRFPLTRIHTPHAPGACRGRNTGWRRAKGRIVVFADDDCWYPPWLFAKVDALMRETKADVVSGRATDATGRSINARFEATAQRIDRNNAWTTAIEWMIFVRREIVDMIGGFDETMGPGAGTPWGAGEAQDIILRALSKGLVCQYDPSLHGFHAEFDLGKLDPVMIERAIGYGRGMGLVIRRHGFGPASAAYWIVRPTLATALYALRGDKLRAQYYANVARGRFAGWRQKA
jgi:glycosyltransferase involved in cell wall biosynthesis